MRIVCIGGGPASLFFSILMRKAYPDTDITVYERNRADDTFGWGVVFSDETLGNIEAADPESLAEIRANFAYWGDIDTYIHDELVRSTGHGFCGLARKRMLEILHDRARALGIELVFEHDIENFEDFLDADLVVAADGVNSQVRERWAEHFRPTVEWGKARFTWLGTTKPLDAFTFIFRENEHGLFQVHAYPFEEGRSTFIVECHEDTWRRAGLEEATEEETVAYMEALFADHLKGHRLLTNRSIWRSFPTIRCERWHHENVVLLGDAVHTAHFSIGSGTKLAMEDAIALVDAFRAHGPSDVPTVLQAYHDARWLDAVKLQKAAVTSQTWFEHAERYRHQRPLPFTFNLLTRSKRITYDNLGERDPALVAAVTEDFVERHGGARSSDGVPAPPMFAPYRVGLLELANRVVVSPMCQYQAVDGLVGDWHLAHLGALAVGGAGLVMTEMTDVLADGRITLGCAGLWRDDHARAWKRIVDFVHARSTARIGIQLAHAGRKASCNLPWEGDDPLRGDAAWPTVGPSALPFDEGWPTPAELDRAGMDELRDAFVQAAERAEGAGFDLVELHMAHGYLLGSFLSPVSNQRTDAYGGSLEKRLRYPLEVLEAVRGTWPATKPVLVRISATDWLPPGEGLDGEDAVRVARALGEHGCDLVDVSTAGNTPLSRPIYGRMYQLPFAERIRYEAGVPVMTVGAIQGWDHVNTIIAAERADLCALARPHLLDPHLTMRASVAYGYDGQAWPPNWLPAKPTPRREP